MWNHTWIEWIINLGKYLMNMGGFFSDIIIMEGIFFIDLDDKVHEDFLNRMKTDTEHLSDDISPLVSFYLSFHRNRKLESILGVSQFYF